MIFLLINIHDEILHRWKIIYQEIYLLDCAPSGFRKNRISLNRIFNKRASQIRNILCDCFGKFRRFFVNILKLLTIQDFRRRYHRMLDSLIGDVFRCVDHFIDVDLDFNFFVQNLIRHFDPLRNRFRQIGTHIWILTVCFSLRFLPVKVFARGVQLLHHPPLSISSSLVIGAGGAGSSDDGAFEIGASPSIKARWLLFLFSTTRPDSTTL